MSYAIWPVESLGVKINEEYLNCLKEDLKNKDQILEQLKSKAILGTITKYQFDLFKQLCIDVEEILLENIDDYFYECSVGDEGYQEYHGGRYSENYAYSRPLDINKGSVGDGEVFDGYVYEFSWGAKNVYEPEFKNKNYLLDEIKKNLYIPTDFDLENNIVFITAVCRG